MRRRKIFIREFTGWLVANLALPLIAPFVVALFCALMAGVVGRISIAHQASTLSYCLELLSVLVQKGVYSFLGITLLLSLLQDYKIATTVIKGLWGLLYIAILLPLGFIFLRSLDLVAGQTDYSSDDIKNMLTCLLTFAIIFSVSFKKMIIDRKIKEMYSL
jgi:hypothetical protein